MKPSISVVIPTYNRFHMLVPVVESILGQTVPVDEIIVVDDGSEDETAERMPQYIADRPLWRAKVRYIRQKNQGQSVALNHGIAEAKSEWLGFGANDDLWLPWRLEWQFRSLQQHPGCGLCFTDAWFMNNPHMKGNLFQKYAQQLTGATGELREPVRMAVHRDLPIWVQTVVARRDLVNRAGNFNPLLRFSEDADFVFRMSLVTPFCYVGMPMVLIDRSPADIRHQGETLNWHKVEFRLQMDRRFFETQESLGKDLPAEVRSVIRRNLRANQSYWATYYLGRREFRKARQALRRACAYDCTLKVFMKWLITAAAPQLARAMFLARDKNGGWRPDMVSWRSAAPSK